jgi:proteasome-associated ATPase
MDYVNQFNTLVDGVKELKGISIILSTNRVDLLDSASVERMHRKERIPPPTEPGTAEGILRIHLRKAQVAKGPDPVKRLVERIFDPTPENQFLELEFEDGDSRTICLHELLSGRMLTSIVDRAKRLAKDRDKEALKPDDPPSGITFEDLLAGMESQLENNDGLPTTRATVREWLRQHGEKRAPTLINPLKDKKAKEAAERRRMRLADKVQ